MSVSRIEGIVNDLRDVLWDLESIEDDVKAVDLLKNIVAEREDCRRLCIEIPPRFDEALKQIVSYLESMHS